jgi:IS30 family transposase
MLGKRGTGAILVLVDRKSQAALLRKLESTSCSETNTKTIEAISSVGGVIRCRSITNDNGHEFGEFWKLEKKIRAKIYFTRPLSPWERGTVENTIGLLRQFIPKGTDLRTWSDEDIELLERIMNARPRKSLRYLTPIEIIKRNKQKLITRRRVQDISWESAEKARWSA